MKSFIYRLLLFVTLASAAFVFQACGASASASAQEVYVTQLEERTVPVGDFTAVFVSDDFEVSLSRGNYGVRVTTDKVLSSYVQVYVRSKTLFISYDEKSVPKDVRKMFKGRKAPKPVFRAIVFLPELSGISLCDNATLHASDEFSGSRFELDLADKSQLKSLNLNANEVSVHMKKNTQANFAISVTGKMDMTLDGNANMKATAKADLIQLSASNDAKVVMSGECRQFLTTCSGSSDINASEKVSERVEVQMSGSSKMQINGEVPVLLIRAEKNAQLEASSLVTGKVDAQMSGSCRADVNVSEDIDATLVGGSTLYYTGTPQIRIGKIIKSTLAPQGASAKL